MSVAVLHSRALVGIHAPPETVEVLLINGLPMFNLIGLPETEVRESRDRVRAALQNARFEFPTRRITVNLAPADLLKDADPLRPQRPWPSDRSRGGFRDANRRGREHHRRPQ